MSMAPRWRSREVVSRATRRRKLARWESSSILQPSATRYLLQTLPMERRRAPVKVVRGYTTSNTALNNVNLSNNSAVNGGGLYVDSSTTTFNSGQVTGNSASQYGGEILNVGTLVLGTAANPITGTQATPVYVQYNSAGIDGGGIESCGTLGGPSLGLVLYNTPNNISTGCGGQFAPVRSAATTAKNVKQSHHP